MRRSFSVGGVIAIAAIGIAAFSTADMQAHKAVTSKYSYVKDVFPILRDHCAECHVAGGPAPMSLVTYKDAVSWAEAVRDELTAERMPPWPTDPLSPAVKGAHAINARDLDIVVTWASGGTPYGDVKADVPDVKFSPGWKLGTPDLKIAMDAPHTVVPGTLDETCDFTLATGLTEVKWAKAVDLLPGSPTLVRDATISVENGPVLALWQPGGETVAVPAETAFKLPAGAKLHLQIHYKKHFDVEQDSVSDRSTIGLYFTDPPASGRELQSLTLDGSGATLAKAVSAPARILAVRPLLDRPYESIDIDAVSPSGARVSLLKLRGARPQWFRRYWLQDKVEVAAGSRIEATLTPLSSSVDEPKLPQRFPLQIALDYIAE
jgi:hypothetical protein